MKRSALLFLAAFALSSSAIGQTIYKLQRPDGRTVYSDKVLPQTKVQKEFTDKESALSIIPPPGPIASSSPSAQNQVTGQLSERDRLWRERNQAMAGLDAARRAKVDGEEPLPGERTGTVSGRARLNDAYWTRQNALQRSVDLAQRHLERAEQALRESGS